MTNKETVINLLNTLLSKLDTVTMNDIVTNIDKFSLLFNITEEEKEEIKNEINAKYKIFMTLGSVVQGNGIHKKWFDSRRAVKPMKFWLRYRDYLTVDKGFASNVVNTIDASSDRIIDLLGDPEGEPFNRRGLVIGDVQSGKTANYTALINKAADVGYKVIVLLTGTLENLRKQTQVRLDEGFVGLDSLSIIKKRANSFIGVGKFDSSINVLSLTSTSSDFNTAAATHLVATISNINAPILLVIKKNKSILERVIDWLNLSKGYLPKVDEPILVIDDEADNASINTKSVEEDPTTINKKIREILNMFTKSTYVGFTATPFANIFINPETDNDMIGEDLFPRDFIYALDAPSNYIGARTIFPSTNEDGETVEAQHGYMLKKINDEEINKVIPESHKTDFVFSLGVIEHMNKKQQREYVKKCKELSNKYILIAIPNQDSSVFQNYVKWSSKDGSKYEEEHQPLNLSQLKELMEMEGLEIIDQDGFQVFLSEGKFWNDAKVNCDALKQQLSCFNYKNLNDFPDVDFLYEDIEMLKVCENNLSREFRMKNSFMQYVFAKKQETLGLKPGDKISVFAPSRSMNIISEDCQSLAKARLADMGLNVEYGKNVFDSLQYYDCGSIENRLYDLHNIFQDESVKGALTVIGGFNVNQILPYIDYDLIKSNPKVLCGFSDITALFNAIYAKTGMMTFYGPHFSSFGMKKGCDYTIEYFKKLIFEDNVVEIKSSDTYSDDFWFIDQDNREFIKSDGMFGINDGCAYGKLVGGNLSTLNLLQGTEYMPSLKDKILFIEDDDIVGDGFFREFDRNLVSLMQIPDFSCVKGIIVGIAQKKCDMNRDKWKAMLNKKELKDIPIIVDVNFGHTTPICTIPIGGYCKIISNGNSSKIYMAKHDFVKDV